MAKDTDGLLLTASLDINGTYKKIKEEDIAKLNAKLANDNSARVKIVGGLDLNKTQSLMQSQIATIGKNLKLNIGQIDTGSLNTVQNATQNITANLKSVQTQAQTTANELNNVIANINTKNISNKLITEFQNAFGIARKTKDEFKNLFAELNNAWYAGDVEKYNQVLKQIYDTTTKNVKVSKELSQEAQNIIDVYKGQLTDGSKVYINPQLKSDLEYLIGAGKKLQSVLSTVFGVGKWSYNSGIGFDVLLSSNQTEKLASDANTIVNAYENIIKAKSMGNGNPIFTKDGVEIIENEARAILNLKNEYIDLNGIKHTYVEGFGWFEEVTGESEKVVTSLNNIQTEANETSASLKNIGHNFISDSHIQDTFSSLSEAEKYFNGLKLGEVSTELNKGSLQGLKDFTIQVKSTTGEVERFKYVVNNIGDVQNPIPKYVLQNINAADAGIKKLADDIAKAKATAQKTLASFDNKSLGLFNNTDVYKKALDASNIVNFDDIAKFNNAMTELEAHYQKITAYTRSGEKSLNPFINAVNNMAGMEDQIKRISASADGLKNKSKSLITNISYLNKYAKEVNQYTVGTEEWGQAYERLINKISQVKEQIKTAKAEQKTTDSFAQKQQSMYSVIEQRMKQINQLKIQQLSSDKETSKIIQEQINGYNKQIGAIKGNMSRYGYNDKSFDSEIEKLKEELNYKYRIALSDKENKDTLRTQISAMQELENAYKQLISYKNKFAGASNEDSKSAYQTEIDQTETLIKNLEEKLRSDGLITNEIQDQINLLKEQVALTDRINKNNDDDQRENQLKSYNEQINKTITQLNVLNNSTAFTKNSSNPQVIQIKQQISQLLTEYQTLANTLQDENLTPIDVQNIITRFQQLDTQFKQVSNSARELKASMSSDNLMQRQAQQAELLTQRVKKLTAEIKAYKDSNAKAMRSSKLTSNGKTFSQEIENMILQLSHCANNDDFQKIAANFRNIKAEAKSLGLTGGTIFTSLWANIKKFSSWMSMTSLISTFIMDIKKAITELKEIDTILTEISKTSDRTTESLEKLGKASFDTASKYGQKASDYLLGIQEMSRAGFGETKSENMAELSTLAQSAGDMTAELANQYLIATNAAYKLEGNTEKLNRVLDGQNLITNKNALNLSELAEGTKIVASQAANAGIGADQLTAALGTMIATTQQSGSEMANAFKGILINLQQIKGYTDEETGETFDAESLSKYEKACEAMGVSLKEMKDGILQLKNPMQILDELADKYKELDANSTLRANLLSSVGGKYRANALDSLLSNWDMYKKMLSEYGSDEALGSAAKEAQKTAESWEGMLNALENDWTKFINEFANSDLFKSLIESAERLIDVLSDASSPLNYLLTQFANLLELVTKLTDKIGLIPTIFAGLSLKNVGELNLKYARSYATTDIKHRECNTF